jgi:DNA-binding NarL/FixJ family response regulator
VTPSSGRAGLQLQRGSQERLLEEFDVLLIDLSIGEGQGAELLESIQIKNA